MSFDLSLPGSEKPGTNPEQFFAMGYAACFDSAAKAVARRPKLPVTATETRAKVDLTQADHGFRLSGRITLRAWGLSREQAGELPRRAHPSCPYARAMRGDAGVTAAIVA